VLCPSPLENIKNYSFLISAKIRIGQAFTKVVTSFVSDVVLPIISLLPFIHRNLDEKFAVLKKGPHFDPDRGYNTLDQARSDGALVMAYGFAASSPNYIIWPVLTRVIGHF
jgi:large-conductance mechanosensitive channel